MSDPLSRVVQGYSALASELVDRWSSHASKVAAKLDTGTYQVQDAVADLAATALLAGESGFLLTNEALDAAAVLSASRGGRYMVDSGVYSAPPGAKLELTGPLGNGFRSDTLPVYAVRIEPSRLDPGKTDFILSADATGRRAGAYSGEVQATAATGAPQLIRVLIIVP